MERHIYRQIGLDCYRPASTEPPMIPKYCTPRSQSVRPYGNGHNQISSSIGSNTSGPALVEDPDSEPSSTSEEDQDYHTAGTQLWDSVWKGKNTKGLPDPYDDNVSPTTCVHRDHSLPRAPSVRLYEKGYPEERGRGEKFATPQTRRCEGQWPLRDDQVVERMSRQPLRTVASYSLFPRKISSPPRKENLLRTSQSHHQRDRSEPRHRPVPLSLHHSSQNRSRPSTSCHSIPTPPTPPPLTGKSDTTLIMSPPRQACLPSPPSSADLLQVPTPTFLEQDPNPTTSHLQQKQQQSPTHQPHSRSQAVSSFDDSDDEDAAQPGLAARIVRGLHHKRSFSQTRPRARSGEVAAAQLRRARTASRGSRDGAEEKERERERGRKTSSAEGVLGRVFGLRAHTR